MGWENRDYYRDDGGGGDFLGNPGAFLSFSVPFGTWFGVRVRLHFWLLLQILFILIGALRSIRPVADACFFAAVNATLFIAAVMLHEFGHRFVVRSMGGSHEEFLLWPAGSLIPPQVRPGAWAMFAGFVAGIATNLVFILLCAGSLHLMKGPWPYASLNPLSIFGLGGEATSQTVSLASFVSLFMVIHFGMIMINLLPYYWFDGGYLLQSILWPWTGLYQAINVTCIVGMILAVPMFFLSTAGMNFFGMIFWALLFSSSFTRRRELRASGTGELDSAIAYSASLRDDDDVPARRRFRTRWGRPNPKAAAKERALQAKVDAILEKVHQSGMNSLTWRERRTLHVATERQRKRERAR